MENLSFRAEEIENTVKTYSDMLFRLCFTMLRNNADAEDAVSEVFLKYISEDKSFDEEEHKKALLLKVASNTCRDMLRFYKVRKHINIDDIHEYCRTDVDADILSELLKLPEKIQASNLLVLY